MRTNSGNPKPPPDLEPLLAGPRHCPGLCSSAMVATDGPLSETATPMSDAPAIEPDSESLCLSDGGWTLDLDVFEGPFDLLIPLILNEEIDLLEVTLAEIVLTYIERLDARG